MTHKRQSFTAREVAAAEDADLPAPQSKPDPWPMHLTSPANPSSVEWKVSHDSLPGLLQGMPVTQNTRQGPGNIGQRSTHSRGDRGKDATGLITSLVGTGTLAGGSGTSAPPPSGMPKKGLAEGPVPSRDPGMCLDQGSSRPMTKALSIPCFRTSAPAVSQQPEQSPAHCGTTAQGRDRAQGTPRNTVTAGGSPRDVRPVLACTEPPAQNTHGGTGPLQQDP